MGHGHIHGFIIVEGISGKGEGSGSTVNQWKKGATIPFTLSPLLLYD